MRIRNKHLCSLALLITIAVLGQLSINAAQAQSTSESEDRHLAVVHHPDAVKQVRHSFTERFTYSLQPDSVLFGTMEHFDALYPDSYWDGVLANVTNDDGSLAWTLSRDMMGLVNLYDVTGDPRFLDLLERYTVAAMAARDDYSDKTDEEGRSSPGWSTPRYGEGDRRIYLVHSGLIIQPILEWAIRADKVPDWTAEDEAKRLRIVEQCKETMLWHDYQLEEVPPPGEAVYVAGREEKSRRHTWQPFNRQNLFARAFYVLHKLTGEEEYLERSRRLYKFFQSRLELTPSNAYVWEYEPIRHAAFVKVSACDDISHAAYSINPIFPACRDGFVFDYQDMHRFARTFTQYIHLGDGVFQTKVGCYPVFSPRYVDRIYAWLPLAEVDRSIYDLISRFMMRNIETPSPQAIANLIAYRPKGISGIDTRVR